MVVLVAAIILTPCVVLPVRVVAVVLTVVGAVRSVAAQSLKPELESLIIVVEVAQFIVENA